MREAKVILFYSKNNRFLYANLYVRKYSFSDWVYVRTEKINPTIKKTVSSLMFSCYRLFDILPSEIKEETVILHYMGKKKKGE